MSAIGGKAVNFGFTGTDGIAATLFTGKIQLQNADLAASTDQEEVRDSVGAFVNRTFYNPGFKATLTYIPSGTAASDAITNTVLSVIGTIISITACANIPDLIKTNWVILGCKISGSNTKAKEVTLDLEAHAGITTTLS